MYDLWHRTFPAQALFLFIMDKISEFLPIVAALPTHMGATPSANKALTAQKGLNSSLSSAHDVSYYANDRDNSIHLRAIKNS